MAAIILEASGAMDPAMDFPLLWSGALLQETPLHWAISLQSVTWRAELSFTSALDLHILETSPSKSLVSSSLEDVISLTYQLETEIRCVGSFVLVEQPLGQRRGSLSFKRENKITQQRELGENQRYHKQNVKGQHLYEEENTNVINLP